MSNLYNCLQAILKCWQNVADSCDTCVTMREIIFRNRYRSKISNVVDTFVRVLRVKTRKVDLRTAPYPRERYAGNVRNNVPRDCNW